MIRHLIILSALLCCGFGLALAQVAAPTLSPRFIADNPAAIQLGEFSGIGGALSDTESEITDTSTTPATVTGAESSATFAGLRLVGESISFAALTSSSEGTEGSTLELELNFTILALAIPIGDFLTLGVGQEQAELIFQSTLPATLELDSTTNLFGATLRLGGVFFLGAAFGTETLHVVQTVPAIPVLDFDVELEREHKRFGAAIYDTEGVKWHLEYAVLTKESTADQTTGLTVGKSEEKSGIIEFNAGGFLLGLQTKTLEETDDSVLPAVLSVTEKTNEINIGWVPEAGWSLTLIASESEREEPGANTTKKSSTTAILLSFLF